MSVTRRFLIVLSQPVEKPSRAPAQALPSGEAAGASSGLACDDAPTPAVLVRAQPEEQPRLLDDDPTKNHEAAVAAMTVVSVRSEGQGMDA